MCYVTLLSTSSAEDLSRHNTMRIRFSRDLPTLAAADALANEHRWYVGSRAGCSCSFRHLHSVELGFGAPVDWYPEEDDDLLGTLELVTVLRRLVDDGHAVDCVDVWGSVDPASEPLRTLVVDLDAMEDAEFRLFENHRFEFARA